MADFQGMFKEAWSNALAGVNAAEQEAEKVLNKMADAAGFSPEDVRRHAREFGERLQGQRKELEKAIDEGVRRASTRLKVPTKSDLDAIEQRLTSLTEKVEALAKDKEKPA
ncbi:MAG: phasin family protein [Anaeromyxobacter sp.]|nr:phasin family protein [Anaeromyxobacter sp.]MBL0276115.1 phasin family protein [Anaeromyxobacter sp.]